METTRAPPDRFADLPGFDYDPSFVDVGDAEMAYVETGSGEETFCCLHGEPTWSYLYRHMLPTLAERGRVVAPDLLGFGRSEQFVDPDAYTVQRHYDALARFVDVLDLRNVTLVGQDWGGMLGLALAARQPDRFARLVPMNTGLPDGTADLPAIWHEFAEMVATAEDLDVGRLVDSGCVGDLDEATLAAYRAPFPDESHLAGVRRFPELVPTDPDDPAADLFRQTTDALRHWEKPAFVLFSDADPIFHDARDPLRELLPTATAQPDVWVEGAGHFLQEDAGEAVAERIVDFVDRT